jgi:3-deoxy-D-manno-octulosonic-acid transferase
LGQRTASITLPIVHRRVKDRPKPVVVTKDGRMEGWLLNAVYLTVVAALSPWLAVRRWTRGKRMAGWRQKLTGVWAEPRNTTADNAAIKTKPLTVSNAQPCIWFHAVSVGEVLQLPRLVTEFRQRHPDCRVVISTTTSAGFDVATQKFPHDTVGYWPFDFTWSVDRALGDLQPKLVVLVELEIWPNFLRAAQRRKIPVVIVNGRLTERSTQLYRRVLPLVRGMLARVAQIAVQSAEQAERFLRLGATPHQITVTGNLKFDALDPQALQPQVSAMRQQFGLSADAKVLVVGSTQEPEERLALQAWSELSTEFPDWRMVLVPRHPERFDAVAELVRQHGGNLIRRSQPNRAAALSQTPPVCLLDTVGELAVCWGLADVAFVGGSFTDRGGQNMLEPAAYGAAVTFGPNVWNFQSIVEALLQQQAAVQIASPIAFCSTVRRLMADRAERQTIGARARAFVASQHGATARTVELLESHWSNGAMRSATAEIQRDAA